MQLVAVFEAKIGMEKLSHQNTERNDSVANHRSIIRFHFLCKVGLRVVSQKFRRPFLFVLIRTKTEAEQFQNVRRKYIENNHV